MDGKPGPKEDTIKIDWKLLKCEQGAIWKISARRIK